MALVHPVMGLNTVGQRWLHLSTHKAQCPRPLINATFHPPPVYKGLSSFSPARRIRTGTTVKRTAGKARAEVQAAEDGTTAVDMLNFKHVLLPIIDRNPYLTDGTKQAVATTTVLAKKSGAKVTVIVIDENEKDAIADHDARLSTIRWHLAQGGFEEFGLMERLGEGKKPTAVIGEVADDLNTDLVVISMESIHSKHVDGNLLAEFVPCPVVLLPL